VFILVTASKDQRFLRNSRCLSRLRIIKSLPPIPETRACFIFGKSLNGLLFCGVSVSPSADLLSPPGISYLSQRNVDMIMPSFSATMARELVRKYPQTPQVPSWASSQACAACFRFWYTQSNSGMSGMLKVVQTPPNSLSRVPLFARLP
jgi:hypothetical protein